MLKSLQVAMCDSTVLELVSYVDFIARYNQILKEKEKLGNKQG